MINIRDALDILERAKAIVAEYTAHNRSVGLLPDLIAEVERLRSQSVEQVFRRKNEEITGLRARIKELSELNEALMENGNSLRTRCQKAEAQISELKEKLIEVVAEDLAEIPISHLKNKHEAQEWRDKARQRLAAEMRGVEWE